MNAAKSIRLYFINATSSVGARVLQATLLVWVNQYLLRRIAPEEYSLFPIVVSLMLFGDILKNLLTSGIARFIVEADARKDDLGVTRIVSSMFPLVILASALFALGGCVLAWQMDKVIQIEPAYLFQARVMFLLLAGSFCISLFAAPFAEGLYVRQQFVTLNLIELSCEALRIIILFVLLFGVSTRVVWLVVASTGAAICNVSLRVMFTRRLLPAIRFRKELFSMQAIKPLLRFGAWTSIQGITSLVASSAPALLLNRFGTAVDVAAFYIGRLPETHIRSLTSTVARPALPSLIRIYATEGHEALNELYYRGGRYFLWLSLGMLAPILFFGKQLIELYAGTQYLAAATVMTWLLGIYPLLWASAMFFQTAYAIGKIGAYYMCDIVIQLLTLAALFYAVAYKGWGAIGAGAASGLVAGGLHLLLIWPMGLRLVKGRWSSFIRQTVLPGTAPFAAALLCCYGLSQVLVVNTWFTLGLASLIAFGIYGLVTITFCLDSFDRDLMDRFRRRIRTTANSLGAALRKKGVLHTTA